ncbi:hypothetical protein SLA2020_524650 [Shorea laevis]
MYIEELTLLLPTSVVPESRPDQYLLSQRLLLSIVPKSAQFPPDLNQLPPSLNQLPPTTRSQRHSIVPLNVPVPQT